jgi:hypothetical protein
VGWYGIWLVGWTACVVLKQEPTQSGVGAVRYEVVAPENFQRCLPGIRDIACLESAGISVMRGPTWWDEILWEES